MLCKKINLPTCVMFLDKPAAFIAEACLISEMENAIRAFNFHLFSKAVIVHKHFYRIILYVKSEK